MQIPPGIYKVLLFVVLFMKLVHSCFEAELNSLLGKRCRDNGMDKDILRADTRHVPGRAIFPFLEFVFPVVATYYRTISIHRFISQTRFIKNLPKQQDNARNV